MKDRETIQEKLEAEIRCEQMAEQIKEEKMPMLYENAKDLKLKQLSKTLIEIKEIAEGRNNYPCSKCIKTEILQKISECEVKND